MTDSLEGNLCIVQLGSGTAVSNACLAGIVNAALNHGCIEEIYGCVDGPNGILRGQFVDLAAESQQNIRALQTTPGHALGNHRWDAKSFHDYARIVNVFAERNIRYCFCIGDQQAQLFAQSLTQACQDIDYAANIIGIPCSSQNELSVTDHALGYGSALKSFVSFLHGLMLRATQQTIALLEVGDETSTSWLMAGAALLGARKDEKPLILLPETPFDLSNFIATVYAMVQKYGRCVVVLPQKLVDCNGNYLANADEVQKLGSIQNYLVEQLQAAGDATVKYLQLGHAFDAGQVSKQDLNEANLCAQFAVRKAVAGESGKMVVLLRSDHDAYACELSLAPLGEILQNTKILPAHWIDISNGQPGNAFIRYALPLIQGNVEVPDDHGFPLSGFLFRNFVH